jgi:hypothetical protein
MNNSTNWFPYTIPPCPEKNSDPEKETVFILSLKDDADPEKNPSQFLEWKELTSEEFSVCENGEPKIKKIFIVETLDL